MKLKTSVVISTYNGESYIIEQLESIRKQSIPLDEVIISDDCSSDNTVSIILDYIKEYKLEKSWKVIKNQKNKGWIQNFHDLLYMAHYDIIFLCDQDDIWFSDKVESMLGVMESNAKIQCLASSFEPYFMEKASRRLPKFYQHQMNNDGTIKKIEISPQTVYLMAEGCTMCVRKKFIMDIKKFWFKGWAHDDFLWKISLCKNGMYRLNRRTLYRRLHADNVSRKGMKSVEKRLEHLLMEYHSFEVMKNILKENAKQCVLINKLMKMFQLRIELIKNRNFVKLMPLAFKYINLYQNKKSYLAELLIILKN